MGPSQARVAVPVIAAQPCIEEQLDRARAAGADLIELRVDLIGDADAVDAALRPPRRGPIILTIRAAAEGGAWDRDDAERIALYERLGLLLPGFVDVELATWERSANLRQKIGLVCGSPSAAGEGAAGAQGGAAAAEATGTERPRNQLILSFHDLRGTPTDLDALFDRLDAAPAAIVKAVFTAADALDALRVLEQLARRGRRRAWIALAMGAAGVATRVLARKFGAWATFAALSADSASAPGQLTLDELRRVYRWEDLSASTPVLGVVGWPVGHSRSPHVHNAAIRACGIDGVYVPLPVAPTYDAFAAFMDFASGAAWLDLLGLSVTIPHKEHARRWLEERGHALGPAAAACGSVNTLVRRGAGWLGESTDGAGVVAALAVAGGPPRRGFTALVLGAGGAGRAAAAALVAEGCSVVVTNRTDARARELAAQIGCQTAPWERRADVDAQVVVNCTSLGMAPDVEATPMPPEGLRAGQLVLDSVYAPPETRLLREARQAGAVAMSGVEMFLHQAAAQFVLWHGRAAPLAAMRAALAS